MDDTNRELAAAMYGARHSMTPEQVHDIFMENPEARRAWEGAAAANRAAFDYLMAERDAKAAKDAAR